MRDDFGFDGPRQPLVWRILTWPFNAIKSVIAYFSSGDDLQETRGAGGILRLVFVSPFTWSWSVFSTLLLSWSSSRNVRSFISGLPAFLFALASTSVVIIGLLNRDTVANRYNKMFLEARQMAAREVQEEAKSQKNSDSSSAGQPADNATSETEGTKESPTESRSKKYYDQAELLLNRLIRLVPAAREDNQLKKAELLVDQKKLAEAAAILQQMVRPGEVGNPKAHLILGQYYLTEEFRKEKGFESLSAPDKLRFTLQSNELAIQHLEQVLLSTQNEQKRDAHFFLYQLYVQRRMFELAGRSLEFLSAREPGFALEHYRFFTTLLKLPQTAEAMAEKNHRAFVEELTKEPDNVPVWQLRIRLYLLQKQYGEAIAALTQGIETSTRAETQFALRNFLSDVLVEQAIAVGEARDDKEARIQRLTLFSEAVRLNPANRRAVEQLVVLGFPLDKDDSDQWLFEAKAAAAPGSPVFYGVNMILGLRAVFAGDAENTKTYLDSAAGMGPGFSTVLQALTLAIDPSAKPMLEGANSDSPDQLPTTPALFGIYMILGSRSVVEKKYERGLEFFRKAVEANPNSATAQNNVAYCMINLPGATRQDFDEALVLASNIINAAPNVPNFFETRGSIYLRMEEYNLAIADFERALQLKFPNATMVHRNLVIACRAAGRNAEADAYQKMVEQAEQLNPAESKPETTPTESSPTSSSVPTDAVPETTNSVETPLPASPTNAGETTAPNAADTPTTAPK